jgi:hypothetical protein
MNVKIYIPGAEDAIKINIVFVALAVTDWCVFCR